MTWLPIDTAPKEGRTMFVVRSFHVEIGPIRYTSDPYCVWRRKDMTYARWPHDFQPTHWMPLPPSPEIDDAT